MTSALDRKNINLSELDPLEIKESIKEFLSQQDEFSDFNFEGSGMTVLMDLLSYMTHYLSYYLNMTANEMFIDSALRRDSIVSIAKSLGYFPRTVRAAQNQIDIEFGGLEAGKSYTLPKGSKFSAEYDDEVLSFVTTEEMSFSASGSTHTLEDVMIKEGKLFNQTFVVDPNDPGSSTRFRLAHKDIDSGTIVVTVRSGFDSSTFDEYDQFRSLTVVDSDSKVYFIQEGMDGFVEIYFGDDVVGKAVSAGNVVNIEYLRTSGEDGNGPDTFAYSGSQLINETDGGDAGETTSSTIQSSVRSYGGSSKESKESVRNFAPLSYEGQDRAVTKNDYIAKILNEFGGISKATIWGGDDLTPPQYGKVFISLKPEDGLYLSEPQKDAIIASLKSNYSVVTITPEIVDPDYLFIRLAVNVEYDGSQTVLTEAGIRSEILKNIQTFNESHMTSYGGELRSSKLSQAIDEADDSISHNYFTVGLCKRLYLSSDEYLENRFSGSFSNSLDTCPGSSTGPITSSYFLLAGDTRRHYLDDDGNGNIRMYYTSGDSKVYINNSAGTIDYETGEFHLKQFRVSTSTVLKIYAKPRNLDIDAARNQILTIDNTDVTIRLKDERE